MQDNPELLHARGQVEFTHLDRTVPNLVPQDASLWQRLLLVTDATIAPGSVDDLCDGIIARLSEVIEIDTAAILLHRNDDPNHLVVRCASGLGPALEPGTRITPTEAQVGQVIASKQPQALEDLKAVSGEGALRREGVRSVASIPLLHRGRVLGILHAGRRTVAPFTPTEFVFLQLVAQRAAPAIEHARLSEEREQTIRTLQQMLMPRELPAIPGVELASFFHPGDGDVGGDFYDVFPTGPNSWGVLIGDVCGKGVAAAAVSSLARDTVRAAAIRSRRPNAILRLVNETLLKFSPDRFATACFAQITVRAGSARVAACSGGHPLPLVVRTDGTVREIGRPGTLLGVLQEPPLLNSVIELVPGDAVVLYTDGVIERPGAAEPLDERRFRSLLSSQANRPAGDVAAAVEQAALASVPRERRPDDMATLVIRVSPQAAL